MMPIQHVRWLLLGLSQMSSASENLISREQWGRKPLGSANSSSSHARSSCRHGCVSSYGIAHSVVYWGYCQNAGEDDAVGERRMIQG